MKANEAPEKVYMTPSFGEPDNVLLASFSKSHLNFHRDIEYIRKDAFIEKVCEFINKANLYLYHCISEECDLVDTDKMIEDFRKYMEGE